MNQAAQRVRTEEAEDGSVQVLAPGVGTWTDLPRPAELLGPGSRIGFLERLNRSVRLLLPDGVSGRVIDGLPHKRAVHVEHGEILFVLTPLAEGDTGDPRPTAGGDTPFHDDLTEGARAIVSPTDGVFYLRPSPEDPPFVEVGGQVCVGDPVGLVEVMKTFNQILYDGHGAPGAAEVLEVRVEDSEEVRAGQILVVVR